jgi:hypothetical protein
MADNSAKTLDEWMAKVAGDELERDAFAEWNAEHNAETADMNEYGRVIDRSAEVVLGAMCVMRRPGR